MDERSVRGDMARRPLLCTFYAAKIEHTTRRSTHTLDLRCSSYFVATNWTPRQGGNTGRVWAALVDKSKTNMSFGKWRRCQRWLWASNMRNVCVCGGCDDYVAVIVGALRFCGQSMGHMSILSLDFRLICLVTCCLNIWCMVYAFFLLVFFLLLSYAWRFAFS